MSEFQIQMGFDWDSAKPAVEEANVAQVQRFGSNVILTFGTVLPPIALTGMTENEIKTYLQKHRVPVSNVRRIVVSADIAQFLLSQIQANMPPDTSVGGAEEQSSAPVDNDQDEAP